MDFGQNDAVVEFGNDDAVVQAPKAPTVPVNQDKADLVVRKGAEVLVPKRQRQNYAAINTPEEQEFETARAYYENKFGEKLDDAKLQSHIEYEYGEGTTAKSANAANMKASVMRQDWMYNQVWDPETGTSAQLPMSMGIETPLDYQAPQGGILNVLGSHIEGMKAGVKMMPEYITSSLVQQGLNPQTMTGTPQMDQFIAYQENLAEAAGQIEQTQTFRDLRAAALPNLQKASEYATRYRGTETKPLIDSIKAGNWDQFGQDLADSFALELPNFATIIGLGAVNPALGLSYAGGSTGARRYADGIAEGETPFEAAGAANAHALAEVIFEAAGSTRMIQGLAKRQAKGEVLEGFTRKTLELASEPATEIATSITQNIVDGRPWNEGLTEAGLIGLGFGSTIVGAELRRAVTLGDAVRINKQATPEQIDQIIQEKSVLSETVEREKLAREAFRNPTDANVAALNNDIFKEEEAGENDVPTANLNGIDYQKKGDVWHSEYGPLSADNPVNQTLDKKWEAAGRPVAEEQVDPTRESELEDADDQIDDDEGTLTTLTELTHADITSALGVELDVQETQADAIAKYPELAVKEGSIIEGAMVGNTAVLVRENLRDEAHAKKVWAHEVLGHAGLDAMGERRGEIIKEVADLIGEEQLREKLGTEYDGLSTEQMVDEYMAVLIADAFASGQLGTTPAERGVWERFRDWIAMTLGRNPADITDRQLMTLAREIFDNARNRAMEAAAPVGQAQSRFSVAQSDTGPAYHDVTPDILSAAMDVHNRPMYMVRMPIDDFIGLTHENPAALEQEPPRVSNIEPLDEVSTEFDPAEVDRPSASSLPYLRVDDEGAIDQHEGRHRAALLKKGGADTIVVAIMPDRDGTWTDAPPATLKGQRFGGGVRAAQASAPTPDGVMLRKEDQLNRSFGEDAMSVVGPRARFSVAPAPDTAEFKSWFGDSKVVNADGSPKAVAHGSININFNTFDTRSERVFDEDGYATGSNLSGADPSTFIGSHFGDMRAAKQFERGLYQGKRRGGADAGVHEVYLRITNPKTYTAEELEDKIVAMTFMLPEFHEEWVDNNAEEFGIDGEEIFSYMDDKDTAADLVNAFYRHNAEWLNAEEDISIAKQVGDSIREQLELQGHDGVIYENAQEGGESYIIFEPNQVKLTTNQTPTESPDIRFSVADPNSDLVVVHNITSANIRHAEKMGGIAAPSLAISKVGNPIEGFGEITLVAKPDLIDPKQDRQSNVFGADAYTPRYPKVSYDSDYKKTRAAEDRIAELAPEFPHEVHYLSDVEQDGINTYYDNVAVKLAYLRSIGWKRKMPKDQGRIDRFGAMKLISDKLDRGNTEAEFRQWVDEEFGDVIKGDRIFNGYTDSGNRRYLKHDMATVIRLMKNKGSLRDGEGFNYGMGSVRSKITPQFKSLSQIKGSRDKVVSKGEFEAVKEEVEAEYDELAERAKEYSTADVAGYRWTETFQEDLKSIATVGLNRTIKAEYSEDIPNELVNDIGEFMMKLRNMPTEYFEAKITRPVQLNEFEYALVPKGTDTETVKTLRSNGLTVKYYDGAKSRSEVVSGLGKNVRFSAKQRENPHREAVVITARKIALGRPTTAETVKATLTRLGGDPEQAETILRDAYEVANTVNAEEYQEDRELNKAIRDAEINQFFDRAEAAAESAQDDDEPEEGEATIGDLIGISREEGEDFRKALELTELDPVVREKQAEAMRQAVADGLVDRADVLARMVNAEPRTLDSTEVTAFLMRKAQLASQIVELQKKSLAIQDSAGDSNLKKAQLAEVNAELQPLVTKADVLTQAVAKGATKNAQALAAMAMHMDRNTFDLVNIIHEATKRKGGNLTDAERGRMEDLSNSLIRLEEHIEELEAQYEAKLDAEAKARAQEMYDKESVKRTTPSKRARSLKKRDDAAAVLSSLGYQMNDVTGVPFAAAKAIKDIAVSYIELGATSLEEVVNKIQTDYPNANLTPRVIHDSLGGRIKKSAAKAKKEGMDIIDELKKQARLQGEIADAMDNIFSPERTTKTTSAEVRELQAKLNEYRKSHQKTETDQAKIDAINERIDKLDDMVNSRHKPTKSVKKKSKELKAAEAKLKLKNAELNARDRLALLEDLMRSDVVGSEVGTAESETSAELESLRAKIAVLEALRKKENAPADMEKRIADLTKEVEGFVRMIRPPKPKGKKNLTVEELKHYKRQQDQIVDLLESIRTEKVKPATAKAITADRHGYEAMKRNLREDIRRTVWYRDQMELRELAKVELDNAELERRIRENDFEGFVTPAQERIIANEDLIVAKMKRNDMRREINRRINDLKPKTWKDHLKTVYEVPRGLKLSFDVGHIGRQAGWALSNPFNINPAKYIGESVGAFWSQDTADRMELRVLESEYYALALQAGVQLPSDVQKVGEVEWIYSGEFMKSIPVLGAGLKASERTQLASMKVLRMGLFEGFMERFPETSAAEQKDLAEYINIQTGYGVGKTVEGLSKFAEKFMTSPRFTSSRYQLALMPFVGGIKYTASGSKNVRTQMLKDAAWFYGIRAGLLAMLAVAFDDEDVGVSFGTNPMHHTFGRVMISLPTGITHVYDPWAGVQRTARLASTILTGDSDIWTALLGDLKKSGHPTISGLGHILAGTKYPSEPVPRWEAAGRAIIPIPLESAIDIILGNDWTGGDDSIISGNVEGADLAANLVALSLDIVGVGSYTVDSDSLEGKASFADFKEDRADAIEKRQEALDR